MKRFGISYYLPELYHLKGVKDAKDALARVIKNNRWADLMYLKLEFDMREFERTEMPMMKEAFELLPMFGLSFLMGGPLGSYLGCLEEKSEEESAVFSQLSAKRKESRQSAIH